MTDEQKISSKMFRAKNAELELRGSVQIGGRQGNFVISCVDETTAKKIGNIEGVSPTANPNMLVTGDQFVVNDLLLLGAGDNFKHRMKGSQGRYEDNAPRKR